MKKFSVCVVLALTAIWFAGHGWKLCAGWTVVGLIVAAWSSESES